MQLSIYDFRIVAAAPAPSDQPWDGVRTMQLVTQVAKRLLEDQLG